MHEVLLFGQVPASTQSQVLSVIAGIAACRPQTLVEHHLIFKPTRQPGSIVARPPPKPGSQGPSLQSQLSSDLFYLQLVGQLRRRRDARKTERESEAPAVDDAMNLDQQPAPADPPVTNGTKTEADASAPSTQEPPPTAEPIDFSANPWTVEFRDLPDVPGKRPALTRLMASIPVVDGSPLDFIRTLGYAYSTSYVLRGWQLVHGNIVVQLHESLLVPHATGGGEKLVPAVAFEDVDELKPLDPSGSYFLQAAVRVQDGSRPELIQQAASELVKFRDAMRGVVDLEAGDRLALDTRVR